MSEEKSVIDKAGRVRETTAISQSCSLRVCSIYLPYQPMIPVVRPDRRSSVDYKEQRISEIYSLKLAYNISHIRRKNAKS